MMARVSSVCLYKPSAASVRIIGWEATAKVTLSSIVSQLNLVIIKAAYSARVHRYAVGAVQGNFYLTVVSRVLFE